MRSIRSWILHNSCPFEFSKDQGLAGSQCLAIYLEGSIAAVVLDPVIVADRHQIFSHLVSDRVTTPAECLAFLTSFFSSVSKYHPDLPSVTSRRKLGLTLPIAGKKSPALSAAASCGGASQLLGTVKVWR